MTQSEFPQEGDWILTDNGWPEYKRLVLDRLEQHGSSIEKNRGEIRGLRDRVVAMETKLIAWGVVIGGVATLITNWSKLTDLVRGIAGAG